MMRTFTSVYFAIGFAFGVLAVLLVNLKTLNVPASNSQYCFKSPQINKKVQNSKYENWLKGTGYERKEISLDELVYSNKSFYRESQLLYDKIQVLCIILVKSEKSAQAANSTWATQCNGVLFVKMFVENKKMPVKKPKEMSAWALLCKSFLNVNTTHYDWFLVVYDTTFVLVENLRLLVAGLNPNKGHYLGHAVTFWSTNYNSGQAGYVLSKGSILGLRTKFPSAESCVVSTTYLNQEDFYLGKILSSLKIYPQDTRDSDGLSTFHSYSWQHEFFPRANYYKTSIYLGKCCSPQSVSFQAVEADKMYTYHYLLYHLKVFNDGNLGNQPYVDNVPDEMVWQNFLKERGIADTDVSPQQYYKIWENLVHDPTVFAREVAAHKYEYYEE